MSKNLNVTGLYSKLISCLFFMFFANWGWGQVNLDFTPSTTAASITTGTAVVGASLASSSSNPQSSNNWGAGYQQFTWTAPSAGTVRIECWGAGGGGCPRVSTTSGGAAGGAGNPNGEAEGEKAKDGKEKEAEFSEKKKD